VDELDLARLKDKLRQVMTRLGTNTHKTLPAIFEKLGLHEPPTEGSPSRNERAMAAFAQVADEDLPALAERYVALFDPNAEERNEIQELLWKDAPGPKVPERYRRELARSLSTEDLRARGFMDLLESLWVLDKLAYQGPFGHPKTLREEIARHVMQDPDYEPEEVFELVGAYQCTDARFVAFIEGLCSHRVRPDAAEQQQVAKAMNEPLRGCGVELVETGTEGGYPVFRAISKMPGNAGRPKQIIFAPLGIKPDLRFVDAVNSDVEVVSDADKILMYDRPIPIEGLRWRDLQAWWADREKIANDRQAKEGLYLRLLKSLPENSPPQRLLFRTFFATFDKVFDDLPALIPEVWLHYDPKTVKERGRDALLRQRMDFLLLISHQARVIIEVDGKQHYSDDMGRADPGLYGKMMAADRELRLRGYEVYHFGGAELRDDETSRKLVADFFRELFARHEVGIAH
jgi:very-short-patch-repair endonuclease